MTDPDDCPCLPSAESGTCPHGDRGLWAEFDQTPATPEPTPGADPFALLAACGDHILDLLNRVRRRAPADARTAHPPGTARSGRPARARGRRAEIGAEVTDLDHEPREADGSHLQPGQPGAIEAYMASILRALDLAHWRVHVARDLLPADCRLMIQPTEGRRLAMLHVSEDWWECPAEEKRIDLTHEALHLAHHDMDANLRRFLNGSGDISDYVRTLVADQFKADVERMVDSLSYVIAPWMPEWIDEADEDEGQAQESISEDLAERWDK